jgi:hypothetical protein
MKSSILILCIGMILGLSAQDGGSDNRKHRFRFRKSKHQEEIIAPRKDTFFCLGEPKAHIDVIDRDSVFGIKSQSLTDFRSGQPLIIVSRVTSQGKEAKWPSYTFTFPSINLACEVKPKGGPVDVYETICRQKLFKGTNLDTFKTETFVVIKDGTTIEKFRAGAGEQKDTGISARRKAMVAERNKSAPLDFSGQDVVQDNVVIGVIDETRVEGPSGELSMIYIYNTGGALVCTATSSGANSHDWRLLTYRDNKFHPLIVTPGKDKRDIVRYLIAQGLL